MCVCVFMCMCTVCTVCTVHMCVCVCVQYVCLCVCVQYVCVYGTSFGEICLNMDSNNIKEWPEYEIFFFFFYQIKAYATGIYWRASEVSETLSGVYKFELVRYMYICICMYICMEVRMP